MKIISRYVLGEVLQVFLVSLTAITMFMLVVGLVKEAQQQGLGMIQIAMLVPYVLPEAMRFAVPLTMLFAVSSVFGRLSASNEITALKAAGITPMAAIWPAVWLAVVVSLVSVWLNDIAVSWGRDGIRRVIVGSVEEIIYGRLKQTRSYTTRQLSINVKAVDGRKLIRPTLSVQSGGSTPPVTVSAAEAEMRADPKGETLTIVFRNSKVRLGDVSADVPDEWEQVVPIEAVSKKETVARSPSEIAMANFATERDHQIAMINQIEQSAAAKMAMGILSGRVEQTTPAAVAWEREAVEWEKMRLRRIVMEPWRRWAGGFACLCFVLVGAPMAIRMRNADFLTSFFLCFLPILLIYYPIFMFGLSRVKSGAMPPPAVWLGNVLIAVWGVWLLRRVIRN